MKLNSVLIVLMSAFVLMACGGGSSKEESFSPKVIQDCNKTYYETEYQTTWSTTESASLNVGKFSGKITYTPPSQREINSTVAWGMDTDRFFKNCSAGNRGVWSSACSHFQECVSIVKHVETEKDAAKFVSLNFQGTAEYIKQKQFGGKTEAKEKCVGARCWMNVPNISNACGVVASTYSSVTTGDAIFKNIPELSYAESQSLGIEAVKGFGKCMCVLHNALGIKDDMSIGYCIEDKYIECTGSQPAFCGRDIDR